jgi:hypothetical protein
MVEIHQRRTSQSFDDFPAELRPGFVMEPSA